MTRPKDRLHQDFLEEMASLERFRQRFHERYPAAPLEREDPDVRRLIEAMAFFSVQTRHATLHNLRSTWRRLFAGFFDFLLEPLPTRAVVQAQPMGKMGEAVLLPRGTELRLSPAEGEPGTFRLQRDLRVLPITLESTEVRPLVKGGHRLMLHFESRHERADAIGTMSLHVRHLDEYLPSLAVFHALRQHLREVSVVYGPPADEHVTGERCEVSFDREPPAPDDSETFAHPLQRLRSFFLFPETELFLHVAVPPSRGGWRRFSLCFDLAQAWTVGRSHRPDFLVPFAVPVENLRAEPAQVITTDGTRSEHPIRNMSAGRELALHSVTGVFEMTKTGLAPLRPAHLPGTGPGYEVEEVPSENGPSPHLVLRMPEAFTTPRKLVVEALWHQPRFASEASGRMSVSVPARHIEGLEWRLVGQLQPDRESPLRDDLTALTQLLAWKAQATMGLDELRSVLQHLGTPSEGPFRRCLPLLREMSVSRVPDSAMKGSGLRNIYEVVLEPFEEGFEPLVVTFLTRVRDLLDAWNHEATVELKATIAGQGPLALPGAS
ncbi:type VI secretion system baseplate subunit TssF [Myxococcus sp. K38C18041901]|uniref:type VI secretion system baseplate subunit TssF n=1 Tax=Myxococcus guangdongensis TaxID=2906760 RepID=UPI0020A78B92|nr:type VI secretion system baseplate subunit TssF [Myxococcus guangdongensis]MCP3060881.1 type VI secretion system baseplate subunit TssF [Myxococcus guangdongensis]